MKHSDIAKIFHRQGFGRFNRFIASVLGYQQIKDLFTWYSHNRPRLKQRFEPDLNLKQIYDLVILLIKYKNNVPENKMLTMDLIVNEIIADLKINLNILTKFEERLTPKLIEFFIKTRFEEVYYFLINNNINIPIEHMFYNSRFSKRIIVLLQQLKRVDRLNEDALNFIARLDEKSILKLCISSPWVFTANKWDLIYKHQDPNFAIRALSIFNFLMQHKIRIRFVSFLQLPNIDKIVTLLEEIINNSKYRRHLCQAFFDAIVYQPREELIQGYKTILNKRGSVSDEVQVSLTEAVNCLEYAQAVSTNSYQTLNKQQQLNIIWHPHPLRLTYAYRYFNEMHWTLNKNELEAKVTAMPKPDEFVAAISKLHWAKKLDWQAVNLLCENKIIPELGSNKATIFYNIDNVVIDINKGQRQLEIKMWPAPK